MIILYAALIFLAGTVVGVGVSFRFLLGIGALKINRKYIDEWFCKHYSKCERTRGYYQKWVG